MFFSYSDKKIHYIEQGKGEPIILVHGWGGSTNSLSDLATLLSGSYRCILIDLPGFGESDNPNPLWGTKEYSEVVRSLLNHLDIQECIYFGHSFGGSIGILLSSCYPTLFSHLILCNSSYKRSKIPKKTYSNYIIAMVKRALPQSIRFFLYRILYRSSDLYKFPHLEQNFRKIVTEDLTPFISRIKTKTLILWGEKDAETPVSFGQELHKLIDNSKLIVFPDATHGLPLRNPDMVYTEIRKFIV